MICKGCYYEGGCTLKPTSEDRCNVFLKKKKINMGNNASVNPMDTIEVDYDDLKKLLQNTDIPNAYRVIVKRCI